MRSRVKHQIWMHNEDSIFIFLSSIKKDIYCTSHILDVLTSYFINFDVAEFNVECVGKKIIFDPIEIFSHFGIPGF